jgi:hypothetical protein
MSLLGIDKGFANVGRKCTGTRAGTVEFQYKAYVSSIQYPNFKAQMPFMKR